MASADVAARKERRLRKGGSRSRERCGRTHYVCVEISCITRYQLIPSLAEVVGQEQEQVGSNNVGISEKTGVG